MPRPLMNTNSAAVSAGFAAPRATTARRRILTGRRSEGYRKALRAMDSSGHVATVDLTKVIDDFRKEFDDANCTMPIGIVAKCYLGAPFEVHTLALDGSIVEHYEVDKQLPGGLERARSLAASLAYDAIEVYPDRMVCVRVDGSVVALEAD
jgi:hypothetical protein